MYDHTDLVYTDALPDPSSSPKHSQLSCIPSEMKSLTLHPAPKAQEHSTFVCVMAMLSFPFLVIPHGLLAF